MRFFEHQRFGDFFAQSPVVEAFYPRSRCYSVIQSSQSISHTILQSL